MQRCTQKKTRKKRELIDIKNEAESLIYSTEKAMKDYGDKVDAKTKEDIEEAIKNTKEVMKEDDQEKIKQATTNLATSSQKLGEEVYKAEQEKNKKDSPDDVNKENDSAKEAEVEDSENKESQEGKE